MFYLIVAILFSLLSGYLFKKASGTISIYSPNMMSVIFYFYFLLNNVIGAILIVNNVDDHYLIGKLSNDVCRQYGYWTIMYTIVSFPIGQLLANSLFCNKYKMKRVYDNYINRPLHEEHPLIRKHTKRVILFLSVISLLSVAYTLIAIGGSPLSALAGGADETDLAFMRSDANRGFSGNQYIRNIFGLLLTPFLSYIAYGYKKVCNSIFNRYWFYLMFVASILILTYDLEKSPIMWYLLGYLFFRVYLGRPLSKKMLIYIFGAATTLIVCIYLALAAADLDTLFLFNQGITGRMTLTSCAGVFLTFDIFPSRHSFLGFSSFSNLWSNLLGLPYSERSARLVMEVTNPRAVDMGVAGVTNSLFVSEAYANWGWIGIVLSPIYVGFIIQLLYLFLLRSRKTPFFVGLMITYTIRCGINGGINDYIYNVSTIIMILVYFLVFHFGIQHKYVKQT